MRVSVESVWVFVFLSSAKNLMFKFPAHERVCMDLLSTPTRVVVSGWQGFLENTLSKLAWLWQGRRAIMDMLRETVNCRIDRCHQLVALVSYKIWLSVYSCMICRSTKSCQVYYFSEVLASCSCQRFQLQLQDATSSCHWNAILINICTVHFSISENLKVSSAAKGYAHKGVSFSNGAVWKACVQRRNQCF